MTTSDMRVAQAKLDKAVEEYLADTGWNDSGVLAHWVMVGAQTSFDDEGEAVTAYSVILKGGDQATYITAGLLQIGLKQALSGVFEERDDT